MTDTDRLAALLHSMHGGGPCFERFRDCDLKARWLADRGVTLAPDATRRIDDLEAEVRKWKAIATQYNTPGTTFGRGTRP